MRNITELCSCHFQMLLTESAGKHLEVSPVEWPPTPGKLLFAELMRTLHGLQILMPNNVLAQYVLYEHRFHKNTRLPSVRDKAFWQNHHCSKGAAFTII